MKSTVRKRRALTIIELIVVIVIMTVFAGIILPLLGRQRDEARKVRCASNLACLGKAMNMYLLKFGDNTSWPVPTTRFRGDEWVCVLYWKGIVNEPKVFVCPATSDSGKAGTGIGEIAPAVQTTFDALAPTPYPPSVVWGSENTIGTHVISYCGRTSGVTGISATATSPDQFTELALTLTSPIACDKPRNHRDGINVVYVDSHVDFMPDAGQFVGNTNGKTAAEKLLQYMDDGGTVTP